jgi:DNA polymerase III epsilon subunit-like protein
MGLDNAAEAGAQWPNEDWKREPWLIFDTETTGVNTSEDRIVQLGAVVMLCGELTDRRLVTIDPGVLIPAEASNVHGITADRVAGRQRFADVFPALVGHICEASVLVSYNGAKFDWPLLRAEAARADSAPGIGSTNRASELDEAMSGKLHVDVLTQVRRRSVGRFWKGKGRHRLENVAKRLGIELPPGMRAHRADSDCYLTGRILWETRQWLPDSARECSALLERRAREQDADFQAWLAKQPALDGGS